MLLGPVAREDLLLVDVERLDDVHQAVDLSLELVLKFLNFEVLRVAEELLVLDRMQARSRVSAAFEITWCRATCLSV